MIELRLANGPLLEEWSVPRLLAGGSLCLRFRCPEFGLDLLELGWPRPCGQVAQLSLRLRHPGAPLLGNGRVKPLIDHVFPAAQANEAFDHLAAPGKLGKVLLEFSGS